MWYPRIQILLPMLCVLAGGLAARGEDADDFKAIRQVLDQHFAAFAKKDLDGVLAFWHPDAPDRQQRQKDWTAVFAETGPISIDSAKVRGLYREANRVRCEFDLSLKGLNVKTGQNDGRLGTLELLVELVKNGDDWRLWKCRDCQDFYISLYWKELENKRQRQRWLERHPEEAYSVFVALLRVSPSKYTKDQWLEMNALAIEVTELVKIVRMRGWGHFFRAVLHVNMGVPDYVAALQSLDLALADFRRDEHDEGEAMALILRGQFLVKLNRPAEAVAAFEGAERLFKMLRFTSISDERTPWATMTLKRLDNLDALVRQARTKQIESGPAETLAEVEKIARLQVDLYGAKHWELVASSCWRGNLLLELGRFEDAKKAFADALEMASWLRGPDSDDVHLVQAYQKRLDLIETFTPAQREQVWAAERGCREARRLRDKGDRNGAERALRAAITIDKEVFGGESFSYMLAARELASLLASKGRRAEAHALYTEIEPLYLRAYGTHSLLAREFADDQATNLRRMLDSQHKRGDFAAALETCKSFQGLLEREPAKTLKHFDEARRWTSGMLQHLERVLALPAEKQKQLREAIPRTIRPTHPSRDPKAIAVQTRRMEAALEVIRGVLGDDDVFFAACCLELLEVYNDAQAWQPMEAVARAGLQALERRQMKRTVEYATLQLFLGFSIASRGDLAAAGPVLQETAAKLLDLQGPHAELYLLALDHLGQWYVNIAQSQRAYDIYMTVAKARRQLIFGDVAKELSSSFPAQEKLQKPYSTYRPYVLDLLALARCRISLNYPQDVVERTLQQAMAITRRTVGETHEDYAMALNLNGLFSYRIGDVARAKSSFLQSREIMSRLPQVPKGLLWTNLGTASWIAHCEKDYAEAERLSRERVALAREYFGTGRYEYWVAIRGLNTALVLRGKFTEALQLEQERLEAEQHQIANIFSFASEKLMQAYFAKVHDIDDLLSLALVKGPPSPETTEMLWNWVFRRRGLVFESHCAFQDGQRVLATNPEIGKTLAKVKALRGRVAQLDLDPTSGISTKTLAKQKQALIDEADQLEAAIHQQLARTNPGLVRTGSVALAELSKRLPSDGVLIEFVEYKPRLFEATEGKPFYGPARYLAFVLLPGGAAPTVIELGDANSIDESVAKLRAAIEGYPTRFKGGDSEQTLEAEFRLVATDLDRQLMEPLRELLKGKSTLLIVPDGRLHNLPFAALVDPKGKYLIESYRCGYLASGRDLLRPAATAVGKGVVVFADPDFNATFTQRPTVELPKEEAAIVTRGPPSELRGGQGWKRLSGAAKEGEDLRKLFGDEKLGSFRFLDGALATEEALKAVRSPRILHLATHGYYFEQRSKEEALTDARLKVQENPLLRSGLVLAGANKWNEKLPNGVHREDGWVTAEEVSQFDLRGTDLVVLSACQTGLGDLKQGEGVYGVRRAFQYAGARTLVTSLFEVPDEETRSIIRRFYRNLLNDKGKLNSLHQAVLETIAERRKTGNAAHPFYWSGLILTGEQ